VSPSSGKTRKTYGLICLLTLFLLWAGAGSTLAFSVCVNNTPVELSVRPALRGIKVMLPLQSLAPPLGLQVRCETDGGTVLVTGHGLEVVIVPDSYEIAVNGREMTLGVAPYWEKGEIMVPMQLFVDAFGFAAEFDFASATMWIQSTGSRLPPVKTAEEKKPLDKRAAAAETADPTESASSTAKGWMKGEVEHEEVSSRGGFHPLAISQFLQELREQTAAFVGAKVPSGEERTRLVGVLPCIEDGKQRLDFVTNGKVKVQPVLLADPARLVLDVEGAVVDALDDELYIDQGVIHRVRLSQYQEGTARAVVDLAQATGYQVKEMPDGMGFSVVFNQRVGRVNLFRSDAQIRLQLEVSGPVKYSVKRLQNPHRIVVDLEGATFVAGATEARVSDSAVEKLRVSQFTPTTTRVVMDLVHALEIVDIDAGSADRRIELVFLDPGWNSTRQGVVAADLAQAFHEGVQPRIGFSLETLAAIGRSLVDLIPSGEALAKERVFDEDMKTDGFHVDNEDGAAVLEQIILRAAETAGDGYGESGESSQDFLQVGGLPTAREIPNDLTEDAVPNTESVATIGDDVLMPTIGRGFRDTDFSRWPKLQVDWIDSDLLGALEGRSILIDAGHGGAQPGAPGVSGVWEKTYNLAVALRAGELLRWAGAKVSFTRIGDQTVSLRERVDKVQEVGAEILVSIHANASLTRDATGTETLYHPAVLESRMLAEALQSEVTALLGLANRGIKERSDLYILRHSPVPSALVEVGFLDHPEEGSFLLTPEAVDRASMGLVRGIAAFFLRNPDKRTPNQERELPQQRVIPPDAVLEEPAMDNDETAPLDENTEEAPVEVEKGLLLGEPAGSDTVEGEI